jgi:ABC-2 type transport system ATP-binding protein
MNSIIHVEKLRKTYGATVAVDEVSFEVQAGEIFGMVGPNGAGKTTTIECLEGLRRPDSGLLRVMGLDPQKESKSLRSRTGMQLQQSNLPERMRVWEALDLYSSFYPQVVDWKLLMTQLGLDEKRNTAFGKLSGGQKQRLFIALALLPDPQLIFLDELTTGLDPHARHAIWDLVRDLRLKGKTVLLTTHFMEEAEKLCDHVAILDHGRIVALDTPAVLIRSLGAGERVVFSVDQALPAEFENALFGAAQVEVQGERVIVTGMESAGREHRSGKDHPDNEVTKLPLVSQVVNQLSATGIRFRDLRTEQPTLEDVFLKLTGREMRE